MVGINVILAIDLWIDEARKWIVATLTGFVLLGAFTLLLTVVAARNLPGLMEIGLQPDVVHADEGQLWRARGREAAAAEQP